MHPYLKIGPIKIELMSMHPHAEVLLFHDVLGEKLKAHLRNDTNRGFIVSTDTDSDANDAKVRIAATSSIPATTSAEMRKIFHIMERITGLNPWKQPFKLNSYTPGGHFAAHSDSVRSSTEMYEQTMH